MSDTRHNRFMRRALELAESAVGHTSPNPPVGAVVVRDGVIIGEGCTQPIGEAHAEVMALRSAGEKARGATVYVTLEPCAHHGRTPPCTDALISAGIKELFYAVSDPNPLVNGKGCAQLQAAGITVHNSVGHNQAVALNQAFFKYIQTGLPLVTAKFATTLDGKIATRTGDSKWISNEQARLQGHWLRQKTDAILIGANTAIADNPHLTVRHPEIQKPAHPVRVIVDSTGRVPVASRVYDVSVAPAILATTERCDTAHKTAVSNRGVEVWEIETDGLRVSLPHLMARLGEREVTSLMVEGGGEILGAMFGERLIDRVWAFVAPILIGEGGAPFISGWGIDRLVQAPRLINSELEILDDNVWLKGDVEYGSTI